MTDVPADSWVERQREVFKSRRHFIRDVLFDRIVRTLLWDVTVEGLDNIPASGPAILMINHTTAADPVAVMGMTRPRFPVPMSKIENFWHPLIGVFARSWGAFPVRRGEVDRNALRVTLELLKAGELTLIAPEGTRTHALIRPRDGLAYIATRADPPPVIVPVAIYDIETWLKDLFIPWRRTPVHITYGRGFRLRTGGRKRFPREELRRMMDEMMYQLAVLLPESMRGVYADLSQMTTDYLEFLP